MIFTQYKTAKEFTDDVIEILNRHEIQNNLIVKNIDDKPGKIMATVKDDAGNIILTAIRTLPHPMVMYETDNIRNDAAVAFLAQSLFKHGIDADFFMTEKSLAKSFCEHYGKLSGKSYRLNESLVLYIIDKVNKLAPVSGSFRKATEADMFYLPYWYADFFPACGIGEYDLQAGVKAAESHIKNGDVYIWEDGVPVSIAAMTRKTDNYAIIARVYTPPHLRGKGYSTACVSHLTQKLLDDGYKHCALYANCDNPFSNKVYQKIGYKELFWYDQYKAN